MKALLKVRLCNTIKCNDYENCLRASKFGENMFSAIRSGCLNYLSKKQYRIAK